jgi:hypothetical protein
MQVGVFPARKDDNGEWRFIIRTYEDNTMSHGQMIFGTRRVRKKACWSLNSGPFWPSSSS